MTLSKCLSDLSPHQIILIAQSLGLEISNLETVNKLNLIAMVSERLLSKDSLSTLLDTCNQDELTALRIIAVGGEGKGVIVEQCHQKINEVIHKWRRNSAVVIDGLRRRGLVFVGRKQYRQVYFIPDDIRELLIQLFLPKIQDRLVAGNLAEHESCSMDLYIALRHLCLFLSYLRKNQVKITHGGFIHKRAYNDLEEILGLPGNVLSGWVAPHAATDEEGSDEPPDFAPRVPRTAWEGSAILTFLYRYSKTRMLITQSDNGTILVRKIPELMSKNPLHILVDMLQFWRSNYVDCDNDLDCAFRILRWLPENAIVSVKSLFREVGQVSTARTCHCLDHRFKVVFEDLLFYLGGLALVKAGDDVIGCRLTEIARKLENDSEISEIKVREISTEDCFYIQPDFEVLVPGNIKMDILWNLDLLADLKKSDQVMTYEITHRSIYRALSSGMTGPVLMEFLKRHSRVSLPQNVSYSIKQWCDGYGHMLFLDALILHCDTQALAREVAYSPKTSKYIKGFLSDVDLIVDRKYYKNLLDVLESEGYMPVPNPVPDSTDSSCTD